MGAFISEEEMEAGETADVLAWQDRARLILILAGGISIPESLSWLSGGFLSGALDLQRNTRLIIQAPFSLLLLRRLDSNRSARQAREGIEVGEVCSVCHIEAELCFDF